MIQYRYPKGFVKYKYKSGYYHDYVFTLCVKVDQSVLNLNPSNKFRLPITLGVSKRHYKDSFNKAEGKKVAESRMRQFFYKLHTLQMVPTKEYEKNGEMLISPEHLIFTYVLDDAIQNAPIMLQFKTTIGNPNPPVLIGCEFRCEDLTCE